MKNLSDEKLFELCKRFGAQALEARRKFLGLLPEVNKRRLFEKKGFSSIFEFAAKLAGVSKEQVCNVLNLDRQFEDKPALQSLLLNGEVSVNKLVRVASIASVENQVELAEKVKLLPKSALETLVRDEKVARMNDENKMSGDIENENVNGSQMPIFGGAQLPGQPAEINISRDLKLIKLLSEDVKAELAMLAEKGIDINGIIAATLQKRNMEIAQEKEQIATPHIHGTGRYIPAKIRNLISKEHGDKCSMPNCHKPAKILHHTLRFALAKSHDPRFMAPLCEGHHVLAHRVDVKVADFHRRSAYNYL